jgi:hypothetical protein
VLFSAGRAVCYLIDSRCPEDAVVKSRLALAVAIASTASLLVFAAGWKASDIHRDHSIGTLDQRQECSVLGQRILKKMNSSAALGDSVFLNEVGYSGSRDSCIAQFDTFSLDPNFPEKRETVQDLLSGKILDMQDCMRPCEPEKWITLIGESGTKYREFVK